VIKKFTCNDRNHDTALDHRRNLGGYSHNLNGSTAVDQPTKQNGNQNYGKGMKAAKVRNHDARIPASTRQLRLHTMDNARDLHKTSQTCDGSAESKHQNDIPLHVDSRIFRRFHAALNHMNLVARRGIV